MVKLSKLEYMILVAMFGLVLATFLLFALLWLLINHGMLIINV